MDPRCGGPDGVGLELGIASGREGHADLEMGRRGQRNARRNRRLTWSEYRAAMDALEEFNLTAGYLQEDLMELDTTSQV